MCSKCSDDCLDCTGSKDSCVSCRGSKVIYENKCVDKCPDGYYSVDQFGISKCFPCDSNCKTCVGIFLK